MYLTGNPLGSTDPRDLYDNAENLDRAMNGSAVRWLDRFGRSRPTWMAASGYIVLGDYAADVTFNERNEVVRNDGEYWKVSAAVELPYTVTGDWSTDSPFLVGVGDAVLRQDLATSGGSELVGHRLDDSDVAADRTTGAKLREWVSALDFAGVYGNGTDDDFAGLQAAVNWCSDNQCALYLPPGSYLLSAPLVISYNFRMFGNLYGFTSCFYPSTPRAFVIDGSLVTGGFAFNVILENFMVHGQNMTGAADYCCLVNDAYRCELRNVRFQVIPVEVGVRAASIVKVTGRQLANVYHRVFAIADGNTGSGAAFYLDTNIGAPLLLGCDAENVSRAFECAPNCNVDIVSPRAERFGVGVYLRCGSGTPEETATVNLSGGVLEMPSATATAILLGSGTWNHGECVNVSGVRINSNDHALKTRGVRAAAGFVWANAGKIALHGLDWTWMDVDPALAGAVVCTPFDPFVTSPRVLPLTEPYSFKLEDVAPLVAREAFTLTGIASLAPHQPVLLDVTAFVSFNGRSSAYERTMWIVQDRFDSTVHVSTKQILAQSRESTAANFDIDSFEVDAVASDAAVVFSLTTGFATDVLTEMPEVYFEVAVVGAATLTPGSVTP